MHESPFQTGTGRTVWHVENWQRLGDDTLEQTTACSARKAFGLVKQRAHRWCVSSEHRVLE